MNWSSNSKFTSYLFHYIKNTFKFVQIVGNCLFLGETFLSVLAFLILIQKKREKKAIQLDLIGA